MRVCQGNSEKVIFKLVIEGWIGIIQSKCCGDSGGDNTGDVCCGGDGDNDGGDNGDVGDVGGDAGDGGIACTEAVKDLTSLRNRMKIRA